MGTRTIHAVVTASLVWAWLMMPGSGAAAFAQTAEDQAAATRTFSERVDRYVRLRDRLEAPLLPFDGRRDSWSLMLSRRYLASAIRSARPNAAQGQIFAPPVGDMFRTLIAQAVYQVDIEGLVSQEPEPSVDLVVNEPVPSWALEPVPGALLERLLPLPAGLEYRIVHGSLVLWDVHAEILIDVLPDAFTGE